ncbi:amidase signature domain-containing protein [Ilyonectria robusta]|uniref:amidase signature domain-containing protein n=1 Tax=Ilyonectria robusta TaxID=1079257 RepID=UPI001E8ED7EC|nr:amidase signature domain-containing protein [Ilyonectria robusta]KAH8663813.1 amidase signature domain-containing protein [Ilyonectria robusta]
MDSGSDSLQDKVPSLIDAALDDLQRGLSRKQFTSAQLAQAYKARIAEVNSIFNDVVDINPDAETTARELDRERQEKGPRRIEATSSSTVLPGARPSAEAGIVKRLREAGALILGTANLSEFAGFRHTNANPGWSARGGQATGIF